MKTTETIAVAADHAGFPLKAALVDVLAKEGYEVLDLGATGPESVDYPDFADRLAKTIERGGAARGVLVCGSGIGISIAANRHACVRAALCHDTEDAALARQHNNANVIAFAGRKTDTADAAAMLRVFLETEFEGGRHSRRVAKMS